jgi:hypothetical protein
VTHLVEQQANYERNSNREAKPQSRKLNANKRAHGKQKPSCIVHPERDHKSVHAHTLAQPQARCANSLTRPVLFRNFLFAPGLESMGKRKMLLVLAHVECQNLIYLIQQLTTTRILNLQTFACI